MDLIKMNMAMHSRFYWACYSCPYLVDYQSIEASKLKEAGDNVSTHKIK
jgi:hypothetical protein